MTYGGRFMCIDISLLLISDVYIAVCSECQIRVFRCRGCLPACYSACLVSMALRAGCKYLTD